MACLLLKMDCMLLFYFISFGRVIKFWLWYFMSFFWTTFTPKCEMKYWIVIERESSWDIRLIQCLFCSISLSLSLSLSHALARVHTSWCRKHTSSICFNPWLSHFQIENRLQFSLFCDAVVCGAWTWILVFASIRLYLLLLLLLLFYLFIYEFINFYNYTPLPTITKYWVSQPCV